MALLSLILGAFFLVTSGEETQAPSIDEVKAIARGVIGPLPTLYHDNLTVNAEAMRAEVEYLVAQGFKTGRGGLLVGAVGGDFPMLTIAERKLVGKTVAEAAAGRVPLFMSVQATSIEDVIDLAQFAESVGIYGIQISPPYYWHPTEADTFKWFEAVHNATRKIIFGVYNIPWNSIDMSTDLMIKLAQNLPRCKVLKYATMRPFPEMEVRELSKYYAVIHNNDGMSTGTMLNGASGFIMDFSMTWPAHGFKVLDAVLAKDYEAAAELNHAVDWPYVNFFAKMNQISSGEGNILREGLAATGRYGGPSRLPSRPYTNDQRKEFRALLKSIGVPNVQPVADMRDAVESGRAIV